MVGLDSAHTTAGNASAQLAPIAHQLNQRGWVVTDSVVSPQWQAELRAAGERQWRDEQFEPGQIGRGADGMQPTIRGDAICWVQPGSELAQHPFFAWMTAFRQTLNALYPLHLDGQEFHFARYPENAGYKKHLDQHRGSNARKVSLVLYLNESWAADDGGQLCLYAPYRPDVLAARVLPVGGRLVIFSSALVAHEVMPCRQTRWSIAGWLRADGVATSA